MHFIRFCLLFALFLCVFRRSTQIMKKRKKCICFVCTFLLYFIAVYCGYFERSDNRRTDTHMQICSGGLALCILHYVRFCRWFYSLTVDIRSQQADRSRILNNKKIKWEKERTQTLAVRFFSVCASNHIEPVNERLGECIHFAGWLVVSPRMRTKIM